MGVTAPLGAATAGSLRFAGVISRVSLGAEGDPRVLFSASCPGTEPLIGVDGGTVTLGSPDTPARSWRCETLAVTLSAAIPWEIQFLRSAADVTADLSGLRLESLEVHGDATHLEVTLPPPGSEVPIRVLGDASDLTLYRPAGAAARIQAQRGARYLALDDRYADATRDHETWHTPGYETATDRYAVTIAGLAHAVTLDTHRTGR